MEDIIFDEYDEYELQKKAEIQTSKKHRYSIGFRKCALALALAVSVSTGFSAVPGRFDSMATVEAKKKDNKKPVIKLQGAASLQVTQNESVKIPKATAKDNVDGNLTKKIKVSVKCGKKSYTDLAKKIQKNKAVKFTKIGKYVITYTVSDKAKNKATKKRTITVVAKTEEVKTTEVTTTQSPTTEQVTTAATTTEAPTTEAPTTEGKTTVYNADLSKYGDIQKVTINGNTYNIAKSLNKDINDISLIPLDQQGGCKLEFSNINTNFTMEIVYIGVANDSEYKHIENIELYYIGKPSFYFRKYDLSNNLIIYPTQYSYLIYVVMPDGEIRYVSFIKKYDGDYEDLLSTFDNLIINMTNRTFQKDDDKEVIILPSTKQDNLTIQPPEPNVKGDLDENGVLTISGEGAMANYNMEPNNTPWADKKNLIRKVVIEDGVTYVGSYAFYNCPNLTEVQFAKTIREIGKGAFYGCFGMEDTVIPSMTIPGNIEKIGIDAFKDCKHLSRVVLEEGVQRVREGTFYGCSDLEDISFPKTISKIEYNAFTGTLWKQTQMQDNDVVVVNGILVYIKPNAEIPQSVTSIQGDGFAYREDVEEIVIPDGVKKIGDYVFWKCTNLKKVRMPYSVGDIGEHAFSDFDKVTIQCKDSEDDSVAVWYARKHGMNIEFIK